MWLVISTIFSKNEYFSRSQPITYTVYVVINISLFARLYSSAVFAVIASLSAVCPSVRHKSMYYYDG